MANIFENVRKICLKIDHLNLVKFLLVPVFAWQAALKKAEVNLELLIDIEMLLMMEKELEKEYVTQFIDMQKLMINI